MALLGRAGECAALRAFLAAAHRDPGGTLLVVGEPGTGKTALVDHVVPAEAMRVAGFESESEFPYAALHRLLIPVLDTARRLPPGPRDVLRVACGLADGPPAAPDLVTGATSALLAAAGPVLCVVDDAQWIDDASLAVITGCAGTPGLGLILVSRTPARLAGLPTIEVGGLGEDDGVALLRSVAAGPVDRLVAARLVAATGGNPLALVDLGRESTADRMAGAQSLPDPPPVGDRLAGAPLRQVRELPEQVRTWLLIAAADPGGDPGRVAAAARLLGIGPDAAGRGRAVDVRHPIVRSAVYGGATGAQRRAAHAALAAITDRPGDAGVRALHLAAASAGPDDTVAAELVRAAVTSDYPNRVDLLTRAAELTRDAGLRAGRMLDAAEAALTAGTPLRARRLAELAERETTDRLTVHDRASTGPAGGHAYTRALVVRAEAQVMLGAENAYRQGPDLCLRAAAAVAAVAPRLARENLLAAVEHAVRTGDLATGTTPAEIAAAVANLAPGHGDESTELQLRAFAALVAGEPGPAARAIRRAAALLLDPATTDDVVLRHHLTPAITSTLLWDPDLQRALWRRVVDAARRTGALGRLVVALYCATTVEVQLGDLDRAEELLAETDLARARIGAVHGIHHRPDLTAWRCGSVDGDDGLEQALDAAVRLGSGSLRGLVRAGLIILALSRGDYARARSVGRDAVGGDVLALHSRLLPDLVEAAVRSGDRVLATSALTTLAGWAAAAGTGWAAGVLARSQALLAGPATAEPLYRRAIGLLGEAGAHADLARAHLLYGEWLRRRKRRRDARAELRAACAMFEAMGAAGFLGRASLELTATGPAARAGSDPGEPAAARDGGLTPQERAIADLAAGGATNSEIAAQLFLSANTVDHHLRQVFRKLDVRSRRQLPAALPD